MALKRSNRRMLIAALCPLWMAHSATAKGSEASKSLQSLQSPVDSQGFGRARRLAGTLAIALNLLAPVVALAHVGRSDIGGGFIAGVEHPIFGFDHVVAMVAVGMWGAVLGPPAIWVLPVTFPLVMAFGGVLGSFGVPIPGIEIGIAVSAMVLGSMVAFAARPPLWMAAVLVGAFAIFHGYAHGAELPGSANPIAYAIGFVVATGSLHAFGILLGVANRWQVGKKLLRAGGVFIAACGVYFLTAHFVAR